ncbi:MAG: arylamine N-acetyltransferase [Alphaproteobacteria bacterium]|nr:arylamine N-acetyltransferase [Alphaproteobacteria bacterium]
MDIDRYLRRIGIDVRPRPDLEGLRALHRAHLRAIPYENLDVQLGRPVTIERKPTLEKILERGRGGWCYEMNGTLGWALEALGFNVTRLAGAVMREAFGDQFAGNHLVLLVELPEGLYFADVGFGDGPLEPFRVAEGTFSCNGFDFNLGRLDETWWRLHNHPYGGAKSFDVTLAPADEAQLAGMCHRLQTEDWSPFVQNLVAQRHTPEGLVVLRGRVVRKVTPAGCTDRILDNADELVRFLDEAFAIREPEAASLWPRICARHETMFGGN